MLKKIKIVISNVVIHLGMHMVCVGITMLQSRRSYKTSTSNSNDSTHKQIITS